MYYSYDITHCCISKSFDYSQYLKRYFWFVLPCTLVIVNDIFAYLCGITFGRTQLIAISPKKTVEGFVGAWICTIVAAIIASYILAKSSYLTCPASNFNTNIYNFPECEPNAVFVDQIIHLPENLKISSNLTM